MDAAEPPVDSVEFHKIASSAKHVPSGVRDRRLVCFDGQNRGRAVRESPDFGIETRVAEEHRIFHSLERRKRIPNVHTALRSCHYLEDLTLRAAQPVRSRGKFFEMPPKCWGDVRQFGSDGESGKRSRIRCPE